MGEPDVFMDAIAAAVDRRDEATDRKTQQYGATSVDTGSYRPDPYNQRSSSSTDTATAPKAKATPEPKATPAAPKAKAAPKVKATPPSPRVRRQNPEPANLRDTNPKGKFQKLTGEFVKPPTVVCKPKAPSPATTGYTIQIPKARAPPPSAPASKAASITITIPTPVQPPKAAPAPPPPPAPGMSANAYYSSLLGKAVSITPATAPKALKTTTPAKAAASSSSSSSSSSAAAAPPVPPVNKTIGKEKLQAPSTMNIQLLREYFEDAYNKGNITKSIYKNYIALFAEWKKVGAGDKKEALKQIQQLYKTIYK